MKPAPNSRRAKKRVGRGNASGHGTYSTRGMKGQRARSGGRAGLKKKGMKRIIAALPKLGGFVSHKERPATVPYDILAARFPEGTIVTLAVLKKAGLIPPHARTAKVIGGGATQKNLTLSDIRATAPVKARIEAAGGAVIKTARKGKKK